MRRSNVPSCPRARALPLLAAWIALALPGQAGVGDHADPEEALGEEVAKAVQESAPAQPRALHEALVGGDWWVKLRLRFEQVDQDGIDKNAYATTLKTVLGYETAAWQGFSVLLEFLDVTAIPDDSTYNSTTNGETDRPVVADPELTEINQVFLRYRHGEAIAARLGRQRITLDNQRFIGNVGWRQNEQTFDALSGEFGLPLDLRGFYAYVGQVNRVVGADNPQGDPNMNTHLFHLERKFAGWGTLTLYDYYIDYDEVFVPLSSNSLGGRFQGKRPLSDQLDLTYALEYAHQTDAGDSVVDLSENYTLAELGTDVGIVSAKLGWEVLGGSGSTSFQTPLATLHKFNGWADQFVITPVNGLQDIYLQLAVAVSRGQLVAAYHDFEADKGGDHYGSEIDLAYTWPLAEDLTLGVKYAAYDSDDFATDTTKAWIWLETSL